MIIHKILFENYSNIDKVNDFRNSTMDNIRNLNNYSIFEYFDKLFWDFDILATRELNYYYRKRVIAKMGSGLFMLASYICGLAAIILPILAPLTANAEYSRIFGAVFAALAAAFIVADKNFGGTASHLRSSETQLTLESIININRAEWSLLCEEFSSANTDIISKAAKSAIMKYLDATYTLIDKETKEWKSAREKIVAEIISHGGSKNTNETVPAKRNSSPRPSGSEK